jgi:putative hemolysin
MIKQQSLHIALVLLAALTILAGCVGLDESNVEPMAVPQVEVQTPPHVLAARRSVLNFLREGANECVPPRGVVWESLPGAAVEGFDVYRFGSEGCQMTVSYSLPETAETLYHVTLHNGETGFCWQANVNDAGSVVNTGLEAGMLPELANAAAAYCKDQGYTYTVADQSDGTQCGVCTFDDGQSCNAWAYFQGICTP